MTGPSDSPRSRPGNFGWFAPGAEPAHPPSENTHGDGDVTSDSRWRQVARDASVLRLALELAGRHLQVSTRGSHELDALLQAEFNRTLNAARSRDPRLTRSEPRTAAPSDPATSDDSTGTNAAGPSPEWADALRDVFSDPRLYVYLRDKRFRQWVMPREDQRKLRGRLERILKLTRQFREDPRLRSLDPSAIFAIASYEGINPTRRLAEDDLLELVAERLELDPGQVLALERVFAAAGDDLLRWAQRPSVFQRLGTDGVLSLLERLHRLPADLRKLAQCQFVEPQGGTVDESRDAGSQDSQGKAPDPEAPMEGSGTPERADPSAGGESGDDEGTRQSEDEETLHSLLQRYASMYRLVTRAPRPMRVVAIVGAGASAKLLPRAQGLSRELIDSSPDVVSIRAELGWLKEVYGLDPDEFETVSAAIARTEQAESELRRVLAPKFQVRYPVLKVYEILSHLIKHRFVDAVISLNFDELLDTSVRDELGTGEHRVVVSDRDCYGNLCTNPDNNNYVPILFKLHGTASDPQTLRFTRASYYEVSSYIADRVREVVGESECLVLNLGCGLNERNLLKLLQVPQRVTVFNLSYEEISSQARHLLREVRSDAGRRPRSAEFVEAPYGQLSDPDCKSEGDLLERVGDRIRTLQERTDKTSDRARRRSRDQKLVAFRSLTRHLLVTELLGETALLSDADRFRYLTDRAILEAAFTVTRARGLISGYSLVADRVKRYFDDANQWQPLSWSDVMVRGGLRPSRLSSQTYVISEEFREPSRWRRDSDDEVARNLDEPIRSELEDELGHEETLQRIDCARLADHILNHTSILRTSQARRFLVAGLEDLLKGTEIELQFRADPVADVSFVRPHRMLTISHLGLETTRILKDPYRCDCIAASAQTGTWLRSFFRELKSIDAQRTLEVYLLIAFPYGLPDLAELTIDLTNVTLRIRKNDWQSHNRHMTIALEQGFPLHGIYFSRNRRSQFVSPVSVSGDDAVALLNDYVTMWRAAQDGHNVEPFEMLGLSQALKPPGFGLEKLESQWVVQEGRITPVGSTAGAGRGQRELA